MSLPYPSLVFVPFDILTAAELNNMHANSVALAAGTGLDDDAVTPAKRSGGFKVGIIPGSTFGTTGNKAITGVGFKPKLVRFSILPSPNISVAQTGIGSMTESDQYTSSTWSSGTPSAGRLSASDGCIGWMSSISSYGMKAARVSLDPDGFTLNVLTANSAFDIAYEAYA